MAKKKAIQDTDAKIGQLTRVQQTLDLRANLFGHALRGSIFTLLVCTEGIYERYSQSIKKKQRRHHTGGTIRRHHLSDIRHWLGYYGTLDVSAGACVQCLGDACSQSHNERVCISRTRRGCDRKIPLARL